ncbi:sugar phosphate nucleotidyltransferase [Anaerovoracaceae bacterium 41-7]|uniref:sugar phosphate nucleotidyltransferase n=1 Tax=Emergencia sp. 1XD21-10 TaxID=2304569 RepID=UPI0013793E77|nr:sugar phosphate nucleotidyltransferase [Emergencia sp. 1XD21-10]NCE99447.1 nucleotidyltransferase [Emergencia sp. 1XD21-10]
MNKPVLVIMAAGMGSRYGGLKQIDPISDRGEIILDFSLYDAMMAGFEKIIFIIKKENEEDFRRLIDQRAGKYMKVEYAFQELTDIPQGYQVPAERVKPWGTCHAVLSARKLIDGPFAVINADDYYGPGAFQIIYDYLDQAKDDGKYRYCMVGYNLEKTLTENGHVARGVCKVGENGQLLDIVERTKIMYRDGGIAFTEDDGVTWQALEEGTTVSMNFWGFTESFVREMEERFPAFLDKALVENPLKGEYFLPGVVDQLIKEDKATVKVLHSHDKWYGVTYKEDKQSVVDALQSMKDKGLYPEKLWK